MADYVEPLLNAIVGKLGDSAEFSAALVAVGAKSFYSDLTLEAPTHVITHFSEREVIYPHQQVYPRSGQIAGELDVEETYRISIDTWLRGPDIDKVERGGRAYAAAVIDVLRDAWFDGLATIVADRIDVNFTDTTASRDGGRLGGTRVVIPYQLNEEPT